MLFNSQAFLFFLPVVFLAYWSIDRAGPRGQNLLLIAASYVFYGRWDWRFLILLVFTSVVDFMLGIALDRPQSRPVRRRLLALSLLVNLGALGFFKYFNFFVESFAALLGAWGLSPNLPVLRILLPVGISFYTFQSLSYTIDIYRGRIRATRDPVAFLAFVSFFPQLVAGPIGRAADMVPQFLNRRRFDPDQAADGMRQILWGFVKKVVVADNLSGPVDAVFSQPAGFDGLSHWIGVLYFAVQIYCDFSGYSDIAIGTGRLFGIRLTRNFVNPYFAANIADFWRRWHISLSSWFRDYVYIPLGGSRTGRARAAFNIFATFLLSGLWHGARWTFAAWGALHGAYYLAWLWFSRRHNRWTPSGWAITFLATLLAWVFFRADSMRTAVAYLAGMFRFQGAGSSLPLGPLALGAFVLLVEALQQEQQHALAIHHWSLAARRAAYYALLLGIYFLGNLSHVPFIYFQF